MAFEFEPNTLKPVEGFACYDCNVGDGAWCMKAGHCPHRDEDKVPSAAELAELDLLGLILSGLAVDQVNLSCLRLTTGEQFFHIDGRTKAGQFFTGAGVTPSASYQHAMRGIAERAAGGIYIDA